MAERQRIECQRCGDLRGGISSADYTERFVDRFCWTSPGYIEVADFQAFVEAALVALEAQGAKPELLDMGNHLLSLT